MIGIVMLIVEFMWIGEVIRRLSKDIETFRHPWDKRDRVIVVVIWLVTALFLFHLGRWAWVMFNPAIRAIMTYW
jgi:hypothetical protein